MRQLILILGLLLAAVAITSGWIGWIDEGEVVQLTTYDGRAHGHSTDLWIVDVDGRLYLRADLPGADWLERLRANPEAELRRDGTHERVRAVPVDDPAVRSAVDRAMAAKYGLVDRLVGAIRNDDRTTPVLLEPIPAGPR
jgi:hypothetical protein